MQDFEKLGVFYLGKKYDLANKKLTDEMVLYDSKDLVTHAVCVGMTGSGKTGLCIAILEEAAIDGIPAIVIDPKGDLANLMLTFPNLSAQEFAPWINEEEARKKGVDAQTYATQQAETWKKGLESWGQDGERIKRLREAADFAIYTPGSNAGIGVSILKSFGVPEQAILDDSELLRERVATTATSLLGLLGVDADPIQSREHILLSNIFSTAWTSGKDLDLAALIQQIQQPPVARIGVLDVESFYPSKDRFTLAMRLNNLLAAPGFGAWLEGQPLDIQSILYTSTGKPRVAIFSIAHLADAERMFFVSLLLNQILGWMRQQGGTTSLRALLYMDEIFGYFPPTANPPSKQPLLTLMKQARAFGVGVMLATQNPVDLDYKGLSNAGTWLIGRLQTDRDKQRLLDGLEGAAAGASAKFDRSAMEQTLAGLGARVFLMNNVHEDEPVVFQSRWAMSYLRGPLTRGQIKTLMAGKNALGSGAVASATPQAAGAAPVARPVTAMTSQVSRPVLGPEVRQYFIPLRSNAPAGAKLAYHPMLLGIASVYFADTKTGVEKEIDVAAAAAIEDAAVVVDWANAQAVDYRESDLERDPAQDATFAALPSEASKAKSYDKWKKSFSDWLYREKDLQLFRSDTLDEVSQAGESERDFRVRLQQTARERRDEEVEKIRQKMAPKVQALEERIRKAEQAVQREKEQAKQSKWQTAISVGTTILGAFMGRKTMSAGTIGRATTAARGASRTYKEGQDVSRAEESVDAVKKHLEDLQAEFDARVQDVTSAIDPMKEELEVVTLKPRKTNIAVKLVVLAWAPYWQVDGRETSAWE